MKLKFPAFVDGIKSERWPTSNRYPWPASVGIRIQAAAQGQRRAQHEAEFIELQQRLIKESVDAAVRDSQHIAQLTAAVFTAASEPVKKQIEAVQKTGRG